jgi:hypothetical protein
MEQLDTDSCRGTVPMEPPMPNYSMRHQNPVGDFDDTGHFLQGALCTIAAHGSRSAQIKGFAIRSSGNNLVMIEWLFFVFVWNRLAQIDLIRAEPRC